MRHHIAIVALAATAITAQAQGAFDALKYTDSDILGTARYSAMAGAFSALGGDISAVADNPAGLGIYRWSEVQFSLNFAGSQVQSTWGDMRNNNNRYDFRPNTVSFVWSFADKEGESGWLANNIAFNYTRMKNFNRTFEMHGQENSPYSMTDYMAGFTKDIAASALDEGNYPYDNTDVPYISELAYQSWLINPGTGADSLTWSSARNGETSQARYRAVESGYVNEFQLSYGANISNVFYWGASINLQSLDYTLSSKYDEEFETIGNFTLSNTFHATGVGYNFKFGVLVRPVSFLRIGAALHTPTYYTIENRHSADIKYSMLVDGKAQRGDNDTPEGSDRYRFRTPLKVQLGVGFVIGKSAVIDVDYRYTGKNMRLGNSTSQSSNFADEDAYSDDNNDIKEYVKGTHQVRLGAEVKILTDFALRAGVAYTTSSCASNPKRLLPVNTTRTDLEYTYPDSKFGSLYGSAGFGYRYKGFAIDVAYAYRLRQEQFMPYNSADIDPAKLKTHSHNVLATFSWRF